MSDRKAIATRVARRDVAEYMASQREWHLPGFLVLTSAANHADRMCTEFDEGGVPELSDAYAEITTYLTESRDRLAARYPLAVFVPLDDDGTEAESLAEVSVPAFPDVMVHGRAHASAA